MCNGNVTTILYGSVGDFHIFDKDVKSVKRAFAANVLGHVVLYVLTKFHSLVLSFLARTPLSSELFCAEVHRCASAMFCSVCDVCVSFPASG